MKHQTAYTLTKECQTAKEVVEMLNRHGIDVEALSSECRKIAAAGGPRSQIYKEAVKIISGRQRV